MCIHVFPCAHTCRKCTGTHINTIIHSGIQWCCCRQMTSLNLMMIRRGQGNLMRGDEDLWCLSPMHLMACICKMPSLVKTCLTTNLLYPSALSPPSFLFCSNQLQAETTRCFSWYIAIRILTMRWDPLAIFSHNPRPPDPNHDWCSLPDWQI